MTKNKYPPRKGPTKYRTPKAFRRKIQRRKPDMDQRRRIPVTQHKG